jgi:mannose-6-phosphate isomerase-like protein (cupin superfamily)
MICGWRSRSTARDARFFRHRSVPFHRAAGHSSRNPGKLADPQASRRAREIATDDRKFQKFTEQWQPKIIGELNDAHVKIAKVQGDFIWHAHENEDELFCIVKGRLEIHIRGQEPVVLSEGEMTIIPKGVEHKPVAREEAWIMMIEPKGTVNTGNQDGSDRTVAEPEWI